MNADVPTRDRLVQEGEDLNGRTLVSAHGHRRWKVRRLVAGDARRYSYARDDVVYSLSPLGGDTFGLGGVKALVRTQHDLFVRGWRVVA